MAQNYFLLLAFCFHLLSSTSPAPNFKGLKTPLSIEAIFKGRCLEYQEVLRPEMFPPGKQKNCNKLWELFKKSFASKSACDVPPENYEEFSNEADHEINTLNTVMFWNGKVYPFVVEYAANTRRYLIIRDVLGVHAVKNIESWCGSKEAPEVNFDYCPRWGQCANLSTVSFWHHMSAKFAKKARGVVNVMLNASSGTAFREDSTFGRAELASLNRSRTHKLVAHLVRNLDEKPKETCTSGSLLRLRTLVEDKGMVFECREDERDIRFLQCADQTDKKDCIFR